MVGGVFDLLHLGHIHYFEEAKKHGNRLVVVVARDSTARKMKHTPITPEDMRVELIGALKVVDEALLGDEKDIYATVEKVKPDVIALGYDQRHDEEEIKRELKKRGLKAEVIRLGKFDHDLDGTRKIIKKIVERCRQEMEEKGFE
ncbi:MAG TPA: FAD synthase [Thermoplasmata archaeon]|nr:FAD synthase [Thermoplasmata archaeon]